MISVVPVPLCLCLCGPEKRKWGRKVIIRMIGPSSGDAVLSGGLCKYTLYLVKPKQEQTANGKGGGAVILSLSHIRVLELHIG